MIGLVMAGETPTAAEILADDDARLFADAKDVRKAATSVEDLLAKAHKAIVRCYAPQLKVAPPAKGEEAIVVGMFYVDQTGTVSMLGVDELFSTYFYPEGEACASKVVSGYRIVGESPATEVNKPILLR